MWSFVFSSMIGTTDNPEVDKGSGKTNQQINKTSRG